MGQFIEFFIMNDEANDVSSSYSALRVSCQ